MPFFYKLLTLPLLLVSTACTQVGLAVINAPAGPTSGYTLTSKAYGPLPRQQLDIYTPTAPAATPREVIVFFYGGRWSSGERSDYRFVGSRLAQMGFTVVIPDYRLYPQVKFPAFVEDGAGAVNWVAANMQPAHIYVAGHSAGAHIGSLLATDRRYGVQDKITAFAGLAGPYHFTPDAKDLMDMFGPPENYPQMQATTFVTGKEPPMLLMHGDADSTVKAFNHERLAAAITAKDGAVEVKTYPGLGHVGIVTAFSWLTGYKQVVLDMTAYFKRFAESQ